MISYYLDGTNLTQRMLEDIIYNGAIVNDNINQSKIKKSDYFKRAYLITYINSQINNNKDISEIIMQLNTNKITIEFDNLIFKTCANAIMLIKEAKELLKTSNMIIATSLDGFNGNTSPFIDDPYMVRNYQSNLKVSQEILSYLEGSSIFTHDINKPVQDPLCFRDSAHINGAFLDSLNSLEKKLLLQINSKNDILNTNWILYVEEIIQAISHCSKFSCYRTLKFCDPEFTKLPRFLGYNASILGFATLQKVYCSLDSEIRHLTNPISFDINEYDHNNTVLKAIKAIDNFRYILAIELMHATQAMDLRVDHHYGQGVNDIYRKYRKVVSMYTIDRVISYDIENSYQFILSNKLLK